jgi:periplasmic divalent cation tolerance protein
MIGGSGDDAALIWCPFPDEERARAAIAALLDERLIGCGNIVTGMASHFVWQGECNSANECGALLKTSMAQLAPAMKRLETLHPYETPAIAGWPVSVTGATREWLERETGA